MQATYRILPEEEMYRLEPLYTSLFPGRPIPPPHVARAAVAEVDGEIAGFWFIQLCAHSEPIGIDPQYSTQISLGKLRTTLLDSLSNCQGMEYYIYTATPEWDGPLQRAGFIPIGAAYMAKVPGAGVEG